MFPHLSVKSIFSQVFTIMTEQLQPEYHKVNALANDQNMVAVPVVSGVGHQDLILTVAGHVPWVEKLAVTRSLLSKLENKLSCNQKIFQAT